MINKSYKKYCIVNNKKVKLTGQNWINFKSNIAESGEKTYYAVRKKLSYKIEIPLVAFMDPQTNEIITNLEEMAELFADQFKNAYVSEPSGPVPNVKIQRVQSCLGSILIPENFKGYQIF